MSNYLSEWKRIAGRLERWSKTMNIFLADRKSVGLSQTLKKMKENII